MMQAVLFILPDLSVFRTVAHPLDASVCNNLDGAICDVDSLEDRVANDMTFQLLQTGTNFESPKSLDIVISQTASRADVTTSNVLAAFDSNGDGMMSFEELRQGFEPSRKRRKISKEFFANMTELDLQKLNLPQNLTRQHVWDLTQQAAQLSRVFAEKKLLAARELTSARSIENQITALKRHLKKYEKAASDLEAKFAREEKNGPLVADYAKSLKDKGEIQRGKAKASEDKIHELELARASCMQKVDSYRKQAKEAKANRETLMERTDIAKMVLDSKKRKKWQD